MRQVNIASVAAVYITHWHADYTLVSSNLFPIYWQMTGLVRLTGE